MLRPSWQAVCSISHRQWKEIPMRKSLNLLFLCGLAAVLPAGAQITQGTDTVQDAIRFERQKDAADARQARIEAQRNQRSNADREVSSSAQTKSGNQAGRSRTGSAARSAPKSGDQQQQKQ
jgi:hypothetical protein